MVGSRNFNNGRCERVLNLLEPVYLRLSEIVEKKRITIVNLGVGRGCFGT